MFSLSVSFVNVDTTPKLAFLQVLWTFVKLENLLIIYFLFRNELTKLKGNDSETLITNSC